MFLIPVHSEAFWLNVIASVFLRRFAIAHGIHICHVCDLFREQNQHSRGGKKIIQHESGQKTRSSAGNLAAHEEDIEVPITIMISFSELPCSASSDLLFCDASEFNEELIADPVQYFIIRRRKQGFRHSTKNQQVPCSYHLSKNFILQGPGSKEGPKVKKSCSNKSSKQDNPPPHKENIETVST